MNASVDAAEQIEIRINGVARSAPAGSTLAGLVDALGFEPRTVAIERNGEIAPRASWAETALAPGDRLEIVRFVQGG